MTNPYLPDGCPEPYADDPPDLCTCEANPGCLSCAGSDLDPCTCWEDPACPVHGDPAYAREYARDVALGVS